jgi:glutathione S-transferase
MITLLGRPNSINVRKVLWLCDELGLGVDLQPWGSGALDTKSAAFLALNPNGLVPVLREPAADGEFVLWESNTICRYLAGREGRADLLPADLRARACVEQWMDWQATELNTAWRYAFMGLVRRNPAFADPHQIQASASAWNRAMGLLDAQLARTGAHVAGREFTLADIVVGLAAWRWTQTPIERPPLVHVEGWMDRLSAREGYRRHGSNGVP